LHTDVGDIKIEVFCEDTPKAAENFLALCASDYYNGCQFIRNIKGFMVQTGNDDAMSHDSFMKIMLIINRRSDEHWKEWKIDLGREI
jgi:cyclophilin family peptidyl-prolyl cis-trans isomerase